jgi:hypothetical protein
VELKAKGSFYRDLNAFTNRELAVSVRKILDQLIVLDWRYVTRRLRFPALGTEVIFTKTFLDEQN